MSFNATVLAFSLHSPLSPFSIPIDHNSRNSTVAKIKLATKPILLNWLSGLSDQHLGGRAERMKHRRLCNGVRLSITENPKGRESLLVNKSQLSQGREVWRQQSKTFQCAVVRQMGIDLFIWKPEGWLALCGHTLCRKEKTLESHNALHKNLS